MVDAGTVETCLQGGFRGRAVADRITGTTGATPEETRGRTRTSDPLDPTDPLRPGQVGDTTPDAYRETDVNMGRHPQGQSPAPPLERQNADRQDR